jgi:aldehyde:ferredoxin oxidoreductase
MKHGKPTDAGRIGTDLLQQYGINAYEATNGLNYIRDLSKMGVFGAGKAINCDLDFSQLGELAFVEKFTRLMAYREGIGDDFAEGFYRAADRWGRLGEDLRTGLLYYSYWGLPDHGYDPRAEIEWGYGSIIGERDINEHDFNSLFWGPSTQVWAGVRNPQPDPEWTAHTIASKLQPLAGNPQMLDFSTPNIYSDHLVKLVAWHRHYTRFWKQSIQYCDLRWPEFINSKAKDGRGISGEGEPKFFNAVTGNNYSFVDGVDIGEKIWNLDNAIWSLQGRHRDMVHFADYIYTVPFGGFGGGTLPYYMLGKENGKWAYIRVDSRHLDREKFEEWKTKYYAFAGWDPKSGWPTKAKLSEIGLADVATELQQNNRLGRS